MKRSAPPAKDTSSKKQKVATPAKKKAAQKEKPWVDELIDAKPMRLEKTPAKCITPHLPIKAVS